MMMQRLAALGILALGILIYFGRAPHSGFDLKLQQIEASSQAAVDGGVEMKVRLLDRMYPGMGTMLQRTFTH